ncbi:winged helix-turn-helix transcriptional regulator, partial [Bacillus sp. HC-Mk]
MRELFSSYRVRRLLMSENIRKDIQDKIQNGNFNCEKELTLS